MKKRVVITGMSGISALGHDWKTIRKHLGEYHNAVKIMEEWKSYDGLYTSLGVPVEKFELSSRFTRKNTRSMGRVSVMAVVATEAALADAGMLDEEWIKEGNVGVAYGSSSGSHDAVVDFGSMVTNKTTKGINANTYIKMMGHTAPVNIGIFFGLTGRIYTTSSACTSGSQGIGYAYEVISSGKQIAMVTGGAEELSAADTAVFDTLFATSVKNENPELTPSPFDKDRDGLVLGEGAGTLILEEYEHAKARGAKIYAEIIGYGTNSDGTHVTNPNWKTMNRTIRLSLEDAGLSPENIGYICAHGTGTKQGDITESRATYEVFGENVPISSLKSYMGHSLGACGALEAWMTVQMMREGWFAPTINLKTVDPECSSLDYIMGIGRNIDCEFVMSNNFAFGGINTSLIFRRMP